MAPLALLPFRRLAGLGLPQFQSAVSGMDWGCCTDHRLARRRPGRSGPPWFAFWRRVLSFLHSVDLYGHAPVWAVASVGSRRGDGVDDSGGIALLRGVHALCYLDRPSR